MMECVNDDKTALKLEAFSDAIECSERFKIKGVNEEKFCFVIRDTFKEKGIYGVYIEVPISEVVEKPLEQLMDVLELKRKDIVCEGISRIVGYYSRVSNWNRSKKSELSDRIISRYGSGYGFNGSEVNYKHIDDALQYAANSPR